MSQQCGKCKWWNREDTSKRYESGWLSTCCNTERLQKLNAQVSLTQENYGRNCPVYEERKECEG